jgi:GntR family transcriptional regulator, carbon starvation induced regulator
VPKSEPEDSTFVEAAYRRLRRDIVTGVRGPGEHLGVEYLKSIYALGIGPMREALQRLTADGLVVQKNQKGFAVAPLTLDELWDITEARICVEVHALASSMKHGDDNWEALVVGLAYRLEKYDRRVMASENCLEEWEASNRAFHNALGSACPSKWILRMRDLLLDQHERYRRASITLHHPGRDFVREHSEIREAALARNIPRARELLSRHIELTARGFELWFQQSGSVNGTQA